MTSGGTGYRVQQIADVFDHQFHCSVCGELPGNGGLRPAKARARRHAASNPDHEVWMSNVVMTHFVARPSAGDCD